MILYVYIGRCPVEVNGGIQWQWTLEGTTVSKPCSDAGSMFRTGPRGSRRCNEEGEWDEADLTSCTLAEIEEPFLLVWFVIEVEEYTDDMEQGFVDNVSTIRLMCSLHYDHCNSLPVCCMYGCNRHLLFMKLIDENASGHERSGLQSSISTVSLCCQCFSRIPSGLGGG